MILPSGLSPDAPEVGLKVVSPAVASKGIRIVVLMVMLALAIGSPFVHIESFSSGQMVKPAFFRPSRNEVKCLAVTLAALGRLLLLRDDLLVVFAVMPSESPGGRANSEAVLSVRPRAPSDVNAGFDGLASVGELPRHHFLASRGGPESFDAL